MQETKVNLIIILFTTFSIVILFSIFTHKYVDLVNKENSNFSAQIDELKEENLNLIEENDALNLKISEQESQIYQIQSLFPFMQIAKNNANAHKWEYGVYDCTDFSRDLILNLQKEGYNAYMKTGFWYDLGNNSCSLSNYEKFRCLHNWVIVEVPIEATTGGIIPLEIYRRDYQ